MATTPIDSVTDTLRDAFYVGIGATVIAFQKLQVQRQELNKALNVQLDEARSNAKGSMDQVGGLVEGRVKFLEQRLEEVEDRLEALLAEIEVRLPEQARDLVKQARGFVARAA